ncbi:MAG: histidinol-phosphatase HisJ, partial [Proteobacteria bacterium]|nr:histidinol-phosphatase HisJ [Pseudomonadota bacterium]
IDFLVDYVDFTKDLINKYRSDLDEWIISIHFLAGKDGLKCLDYSSEEFNSALVKHYGSVDQVHFAYWDIMSQLLQQDFSSFPPHRIGHLGLIRKYNLKYPTKNKVFESKGFYQPLMKKIKSRGYALDFNIAGVSKLTCRESYLTNSMLHWCKEYEIEVVYGSDAHNTRSVGNHFQQAQDWL